MPQKNDIKTAAKAFSRHHLHERWMPNSPHQRREHRARGILLGETHPAHVAADFQNQGHTWRHIHGATSAQVLAMGSTEVLGEPGGNLRAQYCLEHD